MDATNAKWDLSDLAAAVRDVFAAAPIQREIDLRRFWHHLREEHAIPRSRTFKAFKQMLLDEFPVEQVTVALPHRPETRYLWDEVPPIALALSLKPDSYLTHFSAMAFQGITTQVPKTIYVNAEQRPQVSNPESLTQEAIDRVFRRPQRMTSNTAVYGDVRLVFINGKHTRQLGVIDAQLPTGEAIRVTGLERTLIDIVVRPAYSGGIARLAEAYEAAIGMLDAPRLTKTLDAMRYVYPYHQAVGFLLERAGASSGMLRPFRDQPMAFDFYLAHGMHEKQYVDDWRLWIPKGFQ